MQKERERERERESMELEQGMSCCEVVEEEKSIVKPAGNAGRHGFLYLSSLDLYWRGAPYSRSLLFYDKVSNQPAMVEKLKSSLAQVLVPFYPAAGRLVLCSRPAAAGCHPVQPARPAAAPPASAGRPSLLCDGQGVEFIVARVNSPLSLLHWRLFHSLARPYCPRHADKHLLPLLSIQVTKFKCGALAIGVSYSNVLMDGHSFWHLMNSWAECAREEAISIQPFHSREVFKLESPSKEMASQFFLPTCNVSIHGDLSPTAEIPKLLHFTPLMISKIKSNAHKEYIGPNESSFSDYDVLCAFMWKNVITFRAPSKLDDLLSNICVSGDMRFRMKPQLPRGYFGNSTIFAFASSSTMDIKESSFGTISQEIHDACKACNEPRLMQILHWLELHGNLFSETSLPWMVADINVASSPKFKVYNVDFGWGKPIAVRPARITNAHQMFLFPGSHGGIDVYLSCPVSLVNQILQKLNELIL